MLAHWFVSDSLLLANRANREGMHANAISLLRQCVEGISVIELGICGHLDAESTLLKWEDDGITPGTLRRWLQDNVWAQYGMGLWTEPWQDFMREFVAAMQPFAHYGSSLAQWQLRLHGFSEEVSEKGVTEQGVIEIRVPMIHKKLLESPCSIALFFTLWGVFGWRQIKQTVSLSRSLTVLERH